MIAPRRVFTIPLPNRPPLVLGQRTLVMGILNVTPDSFADGGLTFDPAQAIARGCRMVEEGADILDIGGESTRPGANPVHASEELRRVLPVVEGLAASVSVPLSIDTYKADVAKEATSLGVSLVNDISNLMYDAGLARAVADAGAGLVLMHNRGHSRDMYREAVYRDVVSEVSDELVEGIRRAEAGGVGRDRIILDPGLGFAKKAEHTFAALAGLERLAALGCPLLSGPSRKSFLQSATGERLPHQRDWGTAAAVTASILAGAHIVRVHEVAAMVEVARVADRVRSALIS